MKVLDQKLALIIYSGANQRRWKNSMTWPNYILHEGNRWYWGWLGRRCFIHYYYQLQQAHNYTTILWWLLLGGAATSDYYDANVLSISDCAATTYIPYVDIQANSIDITMQGALGAESMPYLNSTSYQAYWSYENPWCWYGQDTTFPTTIWFRWHLWFMIAHAGCWLHLYLQRHMTMTTQTLSDAGH